MDGLESIAPVMSNTLSPTELAVIGIAPWADHEGDYRGADLLLGNGFSANLTGAFGYRSLFEAFLKLCDPADVPLLRSFGTSNFELILESLGTAFRVNTLLGLPTEPVERLSDVVREGLIKTVEQNHPRKRDLPWSRLEAAAAVLNGFGDIFTLNYDALLYHIVMVCKDKYVPHKTGRYNDYFWNKISDEHLQFMDFQGYGDYKHLYYLHGALFLFKTVSAQSYGQIDVKLRTSGNYELVSAIAAELRTGNLPLFVSEGTTEEKQHAIARSDYLHFANANLKSKRDRLVIYGASLGDNDEHIADAVRRGTARCAVSVFVNDRTRLELKKEMLGIQQTLVGLDVAFFDSATLF